MINVTNCTYRDGIINTINFIYSSNNYSIEYDNIDNKWSSIESCGYSITCEKYRVMWNIVISMILYFNEYKSYKQLITENKPVYVEIKIGH